MSMKVLSVNYISQIKLKQSAQSFYGIFKNQRKADSFEVSKKQSDRKNNETTPKRTIELQKKGFKGAIITELAILDEHEYQKALYLLDKGMDIANIRKYLKINDKQYIKLLRLLKLGVEPCSLETILKFNDEKFERAIMLLKSGANIHEVNNFDLFYKGKEREKIVNLINKGVPVGFAEKCATLNSVKVDFLVFKQKGYDDFVSSIFACSGKIPKLDEKTQKSCASIINFIRNNFKKTYDFPQRFINFIEPTFEYDNFIEDFEKYIKTIDFEELFKIAPNMKKYSDCEILDFLETHYTRSCASFSEEDLIFEDLSDFLKENYIQAEVLDKLLNSYPLTSRFIGDIPSDWLEKVEDKQKAQKEIEKVISAFQHHKDTDLFANDLSQILNKKVLVEKLSSGSFGTGYKIEIENAISTVIKIFHSRVNSFDREKHGRNIEPQVALFANKNSDRFVKMYFGRVCSKMQRDGFIVTQYLGNETIPVITDFDKDSQYVIQHYDSLEHNVIDGKIIDFGAIYVRKKY